jgi:hypothetical protein
MESPKGSDRKEKQVPHNFMEKIKYLINNIKNNKG